jgi:hypothetical protein
MNPLNIFKRKQKDISFFQDEVMWTQPNLRFSDLKRNDYENSYPSVSKLVQGFAQVEPYMIDTKGELMKHNIVDRIYAPNDRMSAYDFREALALMFLIHDETHIRVHHKGTKRNGYINPDSITGFTFIEDVEPVIKENRKVFALRTGETLTDEEVLTIYSPNPYALTRGYSAARAGRRWTRLDDYIADYQTGFFKNGAVPAGQFIISAASANEYREIRSKLEAQHRGANKNNNVMYTYRPVDSTGQAQTAKIEWIPFAVPNKDQSLKDLFAQANQKIDSIYGVPEEVRGHVKNSNLASAQVSERLFVKWTLNPLTMKIWDKFTHELARVTNGFGGAITYDMIIPQIADEDKAKADTLKVTAETLVILKNAGYTTESIVAALGLPADYTKLDEVATTFKEEEDEPVVQEQGEPDDAPVVDLEAANKQVETKEVLTETDRQSYERKIEVAAQSHTNKLVEDAIENVKSAELDFDVLIKEFGDELYIILTPLLAQYGRQQLAMGAAILVQAGLNTKDLPPSYAMTASQQEAYRNYLDKVAKGFSDDTAVLIRNTIAQGIDAGASTSQIQSELRKITQDTYRSRRLAVSEVNRSQNRASLTAMENIQDATGYDIVKVWRTTGDDPCEFCSAMDGQVVGVHETFVPLNNEIVGIHGGIFKNDFVSAETADLHPHDQCVIEYEVRV